MENNWSAVFFGDVVIDSQELNINFSPDFHAWLAGHSFVSVNFEAPIHSAGSPIRKAGPHVKQTTKSIDILKKIGVNIFSLANNHIYDYGEKGLRETIDAIGSENCIGAGLTFNRAYSPKIIEVGLGTTVVFLAYAESEFGCLTDETLIRGGYAWANHPSVDETIGYYKNLGYVVLVQVHAGIELVDIPLPEWRNRYKRLVDMGASAVICHHPHMVQGVEVHNGAPIFYSLGNFIFDKQYGNNSEAWSMGLGVALRFDGNLLVGIDQRLVSYRNKSLKIHGEEESNSLMNKLSEKIANNYDQKVNNLCVQLWEDRYEKYYLNAVNGSSSFSGAIKALIRLAKCTLKKRDVLEYELILHNLEIESHRYLVSRYLKNRIGE